jgi:hypothetical protein
MDMKKLTSNVTMPKITPRNAGIALLMAFIAFEQDMPISIARAIDNPIGQISVFAAAIYLFTKSRLLGAVALIAAYELVRRAQKKTGRSAALKFLPGEDKKYRELTLMNQFPASLEEEVVSNMVAFVEDSSLGQASFKPHLTELHQATHL